MVRTISKSNVDVFTPTKNITFESHINKMIYMNQINDLIFVNNLNFIDCIQSLFVTMDKQLDNIWNVNICYQDEYTNGHDVYFGSCTYNYGNHTLTSCTLKSKYDNDEMDLSQIIGEFFKENELLNEVA